MKPLTDALAHAAVLLQSVVERAFSPLFTRMSVSGRSQPPLLSEVLKFEPLLQKMREVVDVSVAILSPLIELQTLTKLRVVADYFVSEHFLFMLVQNRSLKNFHLHFKLLAKQLLARRCCENQCFNLRQEGYSVFCVLHHQRIVQAPGLWFFIPENVAFPSFRKFGADYLGVFLCHRDCIKYRKTKEQTERTKQAIYMLDMYLGNDHPNELRFANEASRNILISHLITGVRAQKFHTALFLPLERHCENVMDEVFSRFKETKDYIQATKFTTAESAGEEKEDRPPKVRFDDIPVLIPLHYLKRKICPDKVSMHIVDGAADLKDLEDEEESNSDNWETDSDIDPPPENSILRRCSSSEPQPSNTRSSAESPSLFPGSSPMVLAKSSPSLRAGSSPSVRPGEHPPFVHVEEEEEDECSPLCANDTAICKQALQSNHGNGTQSSHSNSPNKTCGNGPCVQTRDSSNPSNECMQPSPSRRAGSVSSLSCSSTYSQAAPTSKAGSTPFVRTTSAAENSISMQLQPSPTSQSAIPMLRAQSSGSSSSSSCCSEPDEFMFGPL